MRWTGSAWPPCAATGSSAPRRSARPPTTSRAGARRCRGGCACFVLSFIAPITWTARPLVIGPEETLTVTNSALVGDCELQADGQRIGALGPGRSVEVGAGGRRGAPGHVPRGVLLPALPGEVRPAVIRSPGGPRPRGDRAGRAGAAGRPHGDHGGDRRGEDGAGAGARAADGGAGRLRGVRPGAQQALVQATVAARRALGRLEEDDPARRSVRWRRTSDEVVLARRVPAEGRARAMIDGQAVARDAVAALARSLCALLRPARAPAAGRARPPARGPRRVRGAGRGGDGGAAAGAAAAARGGLTAGWRRPAPGARRPSGSGPTWRSWSRRPTRRPSTSRRRRRSSPSASGCATRRAWRRRHRGRRRRWRRRRARAARSTWWVRRPRRWLR